MAELKTQKTAASVKAYLAAVEPPQRRADAQVVAKLMREATGASPALWGPSIVGFGSYRYVYPSGREGEWPIIGFSPRKANLVLYLAQASEQRAPLLARLGKHKTGKACLYLNKLSDVDLSVRPGDTDFIYLLAYCHKKLGHLDKAADYGERVRLRDPLHLKNLVNLVDVYIARENFTRAGHLLEAALEQDPENAAARRLREKLEARTGNI